MATAVAAAVGGRECGPRRETVTPPDETRWLPHGVGRVVSFAAAPRVSLTLPAIEPLTGQLLQLLSRSPLTQEQISDRLGADSNDVAQAVAEAERHGWIERFNVTPLEVGSPEAPSPVGGHLRLTDAGELKFMTMR
jgi:hypothetical protein